MSLALQPAGVAGLFYADDPQSLAADVDASLARAPSPTLSPKAVIAPHAGHVYSGDVAGAAYGLLARRRGEIRRVILMGPNHRRPVRGVALSAADAWQTPLGPLPVDRAARDVLARSPGVETAAEPFEGEHSLEVHLPFIHRALGPVEVLPMLVGDPAPGQVSEILERLWGGPETAIVVSSDLSHFHDYATARAKDAETAAGVERLDSRICEGHRACGFLAIEGLLEEARRRDLRATALDLRNSGDTRGDRSRVVGYGAFAFEEPETARIGEEDRRTLLALAREVVRKGTLSAGQPPKLTVDGALPRPLTAQRATFVTLTVNGELRGCRGALVPSRPLFLDVAENAWSSAFADPRFPAVAPEELPGLRIEISILSNPRRIACQSEAELAAAVSPRKEGLILRDGARQSLFLPSVWAQVPDRLAFLRQLRLKAGLPADHWSGTLEAWRFTTESFGEAVAP